MSRRKKRTSDLGFHNLVAKFMPVGHAGEHPDRKKQAKAGYRKVKHKGRAFHDGQALFLLAA
ncbi:hypothetical protein [Marinospirillum alkaliphilum]|uniref:Alternative ribosome-rescue factor n=1 Tax=Marinospirillum alkaliphilum DSM 21637 TaxID=1122209 RepID=A0A1K1ZI17_9GAMM|nr:hypothetical protein [Marinospirillum alkaliphilum]SFX73752.1 hypothetical protein SAMN02745752_02718 [Marinospirillum alkaliphilum DSM 21637]